MGKDCGGWGSKLANCGCGGRDKATEEQRSKLPMDLGCPPQLRCDECTCLICLGKGFVAVKHEDCTRDPCYVHCTDCDGKGKESSDSDVSRDCDCDPDDLDAKCDECRCETCDGKGNYVEPEEVVKPECSNCHTNVTFPDGQTHTFCPKCGTKVTLPESTPQCSNPACAIPFPDGP